MSRKKVRDLSAVFFIGLFVLTMEPVFLWFFVGVVVLLQPEGERAKVEKTKKSLMFQMGEDAKKHGLKIPRQQSLRNLLVQVYQNHASSIEEYPHLKEEYKEVLGEMWTSLASDNSADHWNLVISSVIAGWPKKKYSAVGAVHSKLREVGKLTQQWDDAKKEVYGGASV